MAIPYVKNPTWADGSGGGTPINAAKLNNHEDGIFTAHYMPAVHVTHNANQALTTATFTALAFNTERFDQANNAADTMHDTITNNSRLTCKYAGVYQITGNAEFAANATGQRLLAIRHQGATYISRVAVGGNSASFSTILGTTSLYPLAVNEYVELIAYQDSGGNLNIVASSNWSPEFMMVRVG